MLSVHSFLQSYDCINKMCAAFKNPASYKVWSVIRLFLAEITMRIEIHLQLYEALVPKMFKDCR